MRQLVYAVYNTEIPDEVYVYQPAEVDPGYYEVECRLIGPYLNAYRAFHGRYPNLKMAVDKANNLFEAIKKLY